MYLRINWGRVKPGHWDAYEQDYQKVVIEGAAEVPGLRGRMLLRDTSDADAGGTLSLWDSADAVHTYEQTQVGQQVVPALQEHFTGDYTTHECEVRIASGDLGNLGGSGA